MLSDSLQNGGPGRGDQVLRGALWAVGAMSLVAAVVVLCLTFWPAPRAGLTATPQPSADQVRAQDVVTRFFQAAEAKDVAAVRALTCSDPSGLVARDLKEIEYPTGYDVLAQTHIDAFLRYTPTRDGAQIDIMYREVGLTPKGQADAEQAANNYFGQTYVLVNEGGSLKLCGGIA